METPQQPTTGDRPWPAAPTDVPAPAGTPGAPGGPPPVAPPTATGGAAVPRNRRGRLVLAVVGGMLALLCLGGIGIVVSLYDNATKIERTSPDAVVDSYLRAYLVNRDDGQAALFTCKTSGDLTGVTELRTEAAQREREFKVQVTVTWSSLKVLGTTGGQRDVEVGLTIAGSSSGETRSRRTEQWSFHVVDEDGWRVCGATKLS